MRRDQVLILSLVLASCVATNGVQFAITHKMSNNMKMKYEKQIETLNKTISDIGPMVQCWTVKTLGGQGKKIKQDNLVSVNIPESSVGTTFIQDKGEIESKYYKIDTNPGTPITSDMVMQDKLDDSSREDDLSADSFPIGLKEGDYVDLRLVYPKGENYIVLSHLRVNSITGDTIKVITNEEQRLYYQAALVDNFLHSKAGSTLYFSKYTNPGIQSSAQVTYKVPKYIEELINSDPNVVERIQESSISRDTIDHATKGIAADDASTLSTGRQSYQEKIKQAKTIYDQTSANRGTNGDGSQNGDFQADLSGTKEVVGTTPTGIGEQKVTSEPSTDKPNNTTPKGGVE